MCMQQCKTVGRLSFPIGSWVWSEDDPFPPWSSCLRAVLWTDYKTKDLRAVLLKPRVNPHLQTVEGGVSTLRTGDVCHTTDVDGETGRSESGTVLVVSMKMDGPVPVAVATLPYMLMIMEIPRFWTQGFHTLLLSHMAQRNPVILAGDPKDTSAMLANLMQDTDLATEYTDMTIAIYDSSDVPVLSPFTMGHRT